MLLWPAFWFGRPFPFWDTSTFYGWGHDVVAAIADPWPPLSAFPAHRGLWAADDFPGAWGHITPDQFQLEMMAIGARSKFYAVPLYLLGANLTLWAPVLLQALLTAATLWAVCRCVNGSAAPHRYFAVLVAVSLLTTAPFFASFLMPDIFAPLAILASALLIYFWDRLTVWSRAGCALLIIAACLVHTSIFAVLVALVAIALGLNAILPRVRISSGAWTVAGALAATLAIAFISDAGMTRIFGEPVRTAPFLEGRVIADGPGRAFLRDACPTQHYEACRYKDLDVPYPDSIIWPNVSWGNLPLITNPPDRRRFLNEQDAVVLGTILHHPLAELRAAARNAAEGIVNFRIATSIGRSLRGLLDAHTDRTRRIERIEPNIAPCLASKTACDAGHFLHDLQYLQYGVVIAALALLLFRGLAGRRPSRPDAARHVHFTVLLVVTVLANGAICGALSGPFERYQARVIWLVPLAAMLLEVNRRSAFRAATHPSPIVRATPAAERPRVPARRAG